MEKKQLLHIDEKNLQEERLQLIKAEKDLNKYVAAAEKILGILDNDQKLQLKDEKIKFIDREVRKKFQFPNAPDEFNLQALGIDLSEVKGYQTLHWSQYVFELDEEGTFVPLEEQPAFLHYYHYADSDRQKRALEIVSDIVELFTEAQGLGLVHGDRLADVAQALKHLAKVEGDPRGGNCNLAVDKYGISQIEKLKRIFQ